MKISFEANGTLIIKIHPWEFHFHGCSTFSYPFGRIFIRCEPMLGIDAYEYELQLLDELDESID